MAKPKILVGLGSCGIAAGAQAVYDYLKDKVPAGAADVDITSCIGMCWAEPLVEVVEDSGRTMFGYVDVEFADRILQGLRDGKLPDEKRVRESEDGKDYLSKQVKVVLRNCGVINPEKIEDYIAAGGYEALRKCLNEYSPQQVIDIVKESGLAGRGGAFFPTATKWGLFAANPAPSGGHKYMVCNADEGDPGAFMDRATIEGDPHGLLEGMLIASYATGADRGYIYCRAEYPLAIKRLKIAIGEAEKQGFLGDNIMGKGFNFHLKIKEGAGAFVCGEETALMASIMGRRGMPTLKPPFPAVSGLFGCPTNINNVETFENVAYIISRGAKEFNKYESNGTIGTKVFALAGKVKRAGLVEIPVGMTIRELVEHIGGGSSTGLSLKAVQMGGPSGGCIPARLFDTTIDVKSVTGTGAIMGSGGFIVMDEQTCMVDVAKYFLTFVQSESCGKCTFCRIGTKRMLEILNRITAGEGVESDLQQLQELAAAIKKSSLCALGQTAPNPVLTTMKYFPEEYEEHIKLKKCRAKVCKPLIKYGIIADKCTGCGMCAKNCPVKAISGEKKKAHNIDAAKCTRCGLCKDTCKFAAVEVS
ncbi:MAG: SLBB domain-containing protein [Spirochaetaceae bacterium]|jgi:NADH-quinone oxidoreductase subunit F|nr:SLBB domain-containing protein [Spirochaetaceae bacterium]